MKNSFKEILKELDWSDGFRIPIANEENKRLENEIEEKAKKKEAIIEKLKVTRNRIELIDQHIKNINIQRDYNQNLLSAYISQYDAEENLQKVSENEIAALTKEIRDIEKEKKSNQERMKLMEAEIDKLKTKLNSAKATVALDESKCLHWEETLNCDEERQQLIEKYLKLDGKKFKELELKRQKLNEEVQHYNKLILRISEDITEQEITLDKTAKFYAQILEERRYLIDRWRQSVVVLRQRDNCIQNIIREIESLKEIGMEKQKLLQDSVEFLDNQSDSNKQLENSIAKAEKRLAILKDKRLKMEAENENSNIEHKIHQQTLNEISYKTESLQSEINRFKDSNTRKRAYINDYNNRISDLEENLRSIDDNQLTIDDRMKQVKLMLENEEKRKFSFLKETKKFQDLIHQKTTQITELENERKTIELQKQGALRQIELISISQSKQEKLLNEKKDVIHQLDLQIRNCEMQLSSSYEKTDKTESEYKKQVMKELQDILNDKMEIAKLLQSQINNLESEVKKVRGALNRENEELEALKVEHQNLSVMMEGNDKTLKNAVKLNEERQVAENIMELRVTQVEELMHNTGTKVHNLEQYHLRLQTAMKERMTEIKILRDALISKHKLAMSECSQLRNAITEKHAQTLNYQARYDTVIAASRIYDTDHAIPTSTIYLKIQNARNKALLQERGDQLDATICRTEQEIKSMENALRVVTACNENYKLSLITDDDEDNESTKQMLEQQLYEELKNVREDLKQKQLQEENMKKILLVAQENHEMILEELQQLQDDKEKKHKDITILEKQITDQKSRISRADMRLKKLYKDIQKMCECDNSESILLQEKDIITRELEDQNLLALQRITEFTIRHVEAEIYVKKLLTAKNIVLPGIQYIKSTSSLGICDESTPSSISSFSSRSREKLSAKKAHVK